MALQRVLPPLPADSKHLQVMTYDSRDSRNFLKQSFLTNAKNSDPPNY